MIAYLLFAAVLEELLFRAGLQELLLRWQSAARPALASGLRWLPNLATSMVFALAHGLHRAWWLAAAAFPASLLLGWVYERRRSLWPCLGLHLLMNAGWLLLSFQLPALASLE